MHYVVNKRTLQFRHIHITHISDEQKSHLECPDLEGRSSDESKHKVSPLVSEIQGQIVFISCLHMCIHTCIPLLSY